MLPQVTRLDGHQTGIMCHAEIVEGDSLTGGPLATVRAS